MGICPHQSSAAKKYAAEISGDNAANVRQPLLAQHLENRHASSSLRLAVVAVPCYAAVSEDIGIYVVSCLSVPASYLVDKSHCFLIALGMGDVADELRLLFNKRRFGISANGIIVGSIHIKYSFLVWFYVIKNSACAVQAQAESKLLVHTETLLEAVNTSACINKRCRKDGTWSRFQL